MKALTIHQPWASLIAIEAKRIETRSWPVKPASLVGQRIAIHAGKNDRELDLVGAGRFREVFREARSAGTLAIVGDQLPLGYIVATARLARCEAMGDDFATKYDRDELIFGHFAPTRWAWVLEDVVRCPDPIPYRGRQGVFDIDPVTTRRLMAQATAVHRG